MKDDFKDFEPIKEDAEKLSYKAIQEAKKMIEERSLELMNEMNHIMNLEIASANAAKESYSVMMLMQTSWGREFMNNQTTPAAMWLPRGTRRFSDIYNANHAGNTCMRFPVMCGVRFR